MATEQDIVTRTTALQNALVQLKAAADKVTSNKTHLDDVHKVSGLHWKIGEGFSINPETNVININVSSSFYTKINEVGVVIGGSFFPIKYNSLPTEIPIYFKLKYDLPSPDFVPNIISFQKNGSSFDTQKIHPENIEQDPTKPLVTVKTTLPKDIADGEPFDIVSYLIEDSQIVAMSVVSVDLELVTTGTFTPIINVNDGDTVYLPFILTALYINLEGKEPEYMEFSYKKVSDTSVKTVRETSYDSVSQCFLHHIDTSFLGDSHAGDYSIKIGIKGKEVTTKYTPDMEIFISDNTPI